MEEEFVYQINPAPATIEPALKWISVRERLPEPGQEILAVVGHTAAEPFTITTFFWDATFDNWARITHWMPLPEPPKMYAADMNVGRKVVHENWIPVTEQLPKTDGRFMVTIKGRSGKPHVEMRNFHAGSQKWESQYGWREENVLAWQARPRPYGWKPKEG